MRHPGTWERCKPFKAPWAGVATGDQRFHLMRARCVTAKQCCDPHLGVLSTFACVVFVAHGFLREQLIKYTGLVRVVYTVRAVVAHDTAQFLFSPRVGRRGVRAACFTADLFPYDVVACPKAMQPSTACVETGDVEKRCEFHVFFLNHVS